MTLFEEDDGTGEGVWPVEQARAYWDRHPWPVGCNFIPSSAVNQLEMWQAETFDPETIQREMAWAAGLGFNTLRVYLHDLVWRDDRDGLLERCESFLARAGKHGLKVVFVLFDDVWSSDPRSGPQPEPFPGRHNSRWVQGPGLPVLERYATDPAARARLEGYVVDVMSTFAGHAGVLAWDLYNEPGGYPSPVSEPVGTRCLPLLRDVFEWARGVSPSQPLTSGLWWNPLRPNDPRIEEVQLENSDIVSFHHYGPVDDLVRLIDELSSRTRRPLMCTEYLARNLHSRFETHLPIFRERNVGALSWGLVAGKTQTQYPWWSWFDESPDPEPRPKPKPEPEPEIWFHDILLADGSAHDSAEADFLREFLAGD